MAGVNSLGIGSGVLTADLLDKLRAADDKVVLKPLEDKMALSTQKEDAYKLLSGFMTTLKSSTASLGGENLYLSRAVTGSSDAVTVSAEAGSDLASFNITNISKAEKDVWSTAVQSTKTDAIAGIGAGTITVGVGANSFDIEYSATTTLDDIRQSINDIAGDKMSASILQTGTDAFKLVITAKDTNEAITFTDTAAAAAQLDTISLTNNVTAGDTFTWSDGTNSIILDEALGGLVAGEDPTQSGVRIADAINNDPTLSALYTATAVDGGFTIEAKTTGTAFTGQATSTGGQTSLEETTTPSQTDSSLVSALGLNNIQVAKGASFDFNGITIERSSNSISDLINGVTITLNSNQAADESASIIIGQNDTAIKSEMELFVSNYNLLSSNLKDMTLYDKTKGVAGIFNSESMVKSISKELVNIINQTDSKGNSLYDYGLSMDKEGVMSLDSSKFSMKIATSPEAMEALFRGANAVDATDTTAAKSEVIGIFQQLDIKMLSYTGSGKLLADFNDQLSTSKKSFISQYDKQKASLDSRYETLTKKFSAYDSMISKLNNQFSSLKMVIDAQASSSNSS
jgi:flagellar hook-associated protein 2